MRASHDEVPQHADGQPETQQQRRRRVVRQLEPQDADHLQRESWIRL